MIIVRAARPTLVTMADNADMQLVAVVLEDQGDVYVDTRAMFDYVYANFSKVFLNEHDKPDASGSLKRKMHMLFCRKELTFHLWSMRLRLLTGKMPPES